MNIVTAEDPHYLIIQHIAKFTWPTTFQLILSQEQIDYMLDLMYSSESLDNQVNVLGHNFILAIEDGTYLGFASYECNYQKSSFTKVHKLYVLPQSQNKGAGSELLNYIKEIAVLNNNKGMILNVNRQNPAVAFYQKSGWQIIKEEDISIGNNFFMNDYVMQYTF